MVLSVRERTRQVFFFMLPYGEANQWRDEDYINIWKTFSEWSLIVIAALVLYMALCVITEDYYGSSVMHKPLSLMASTCISNVSFIGLMGWLDRFVEDRSRGR